ncbi:MAG: hypothetical protein GY847_11190 [Proteobacteria bacterium]|nr:hypothetical protein [Pseudomonadota bacterium]
MNRRIKTLLLWVIMVATALFWYCFLSDLGGSSLVILSLILTIGVIGLTLDATMKKTIQRPRVRDLARLCGINSRVFLRKLRAGPLPGREKK